MSQGLELLIWLFCVGLSTILIGMYFKQSIRILKKEGFTVQLCPSGSVNYVTPEGDTNCCNGDVIEGWCSGNILCTMSPLHNSRVPTCASIAAAAAASAAARAAAAAASANSNCPVCPTV